MSQSKPSYDLQTLIQRLYLIQNPEVIRHFHGLLDLLDQSTIDQDKVLVREYLTNRALQAEESIKAGTTMPQDEFKEEVNRWLKEIDG